jgi:pimeloyl-ACP methyl ester carboxylesterase
MSLEKLFSNTYVAYYLDIRGYGRSTRPVVMNEDANKNKPIVRFTAAMEDVDDVVDFIRKRTNVEKVSLIGWSWGTVISGGYPREKPAATLQRGTNLFR